ncbi:polysaccharide biosynthesis protein [Rhodoflexus caldus]|uniref:polysaccharide biosynthesis protein n=1 Tax=Rhodoflexus caldus TaxID=2891236 RepID=UPI00202A98D7|nr:nucleoside-diphosphate sugar epimerase/dehydratase [Rhodoflexus caldus]
MVKKRLRQYANRAAFNKLLLLATDLLLGAVAFVLSLLLFEEQAPVALGQTAALALVLRLAAFFVFKTYAVVIRFIHLRDMAKLTLALMLSDVALGVLSYAVWGKFSVAIGIAYFTLSLMALAGYRALVRYFSWGNDAADEHPPVRLLIFGAGSAGLITKHVLEHAPGLSYKVVAFFDDDPMKSGKTIEGVRVFNVAEHFKDIIRKNGVQKAVIAIHHLLPERRQQFIEWCLEAEVPVMKVPPLSQWYEGGFNPAQLENVRIEDLLEREPIRMESPHVRETFSDKIVLVTGAAGSIGRELCRQLVRCRPRQLLLLDKAESALHELHLSLLEEEHYPDALPVLADVTDAANIAQIFARHRPQAVLHAAAYKHVPMMENYPQQAVKVNIFGTKHVVDAAVRYGAEKFILVSTDKAVNPTNVMGASKRIAELYVQALHMQGSATAFAVTRFGNVLGSDGSVIPRFKKQIQAGGPVTVTSPDIVRYFMTIPEAAQLILEAGAMGSQAEIFLFDMGQPVRIADLARKMIRLAGLQPDKDIAIRFTGLRPGEKLMEELLLQQENTLPTYHPKIRIAKNIPQLDMQGVDFSLQEFQHKIAENADDAEIVRLMMRLVPEFQSTNPKFAAVGAQKNL